MNDIANVPVPVGNKCTSPALIIDERIRSHIPPLRPEELEQLQINIVLYGGCKDALTVWNGVLLDGHNRYEICTRLRLPYRVDDILLPDIESAIAWVEENQLGRRNLTPDQFAYFIGRKYDRQKKKRGAPEGNRNAGKQTGNFFPFVPDDEDQKTAQRIAAEHGITDRTVKNSSVYARNVDAVADVLGDSVRPEILSGRIGSERLTRQDVAEFAEIAPAATGLAFASAKDAMDWVARERAARAAEKRAANDALKASIVTSQPDGIYETIVIDPPWDMQKIDRDVRPNQVAFDYPTMTEEELGEFGLPDIAADDCHLFCWTTQKFLPSALRLIEAWGFRYVLTMVWHKSGGFQPIGLPQYNCEFVVYARRGTPSFVETKAFPCCFYAERREHSRKPDEFYEIIRRVTGGPRIDIFSRGPHEGFARFGNETEKFAS